ncbi:DUF2171 domain-containing protein [Sphingomonas sabuli]|uniref:DUF2171 domain-containing protein n=1 Tax=Sphingomonas sabuli TaxID=2764186 RepID=A0A7G9L5C2_9SPHN|nr:DUF2171 domain-containing protein [Sphingomonas sabuli]QNM83821.1 DUF2171 domain-containing protein [Sphingomonas sabuli]
MAYDRYDNGRERSQRRDDEDRGFFERAGDEIASWFGDDDAERRRNRDERMHGRDFDREPSRDRYNYGGWGDQRSSMRDRDRDFGREASYGRSRDEHRAPQASGWNSGDRDYRSSAPISSRDFARSSAGFGGGSNDWDRGEFRSTGRTGSPRDSDRHYHSWKQRQLDELDRDYDQYCRERQERFESDFGTWRKERMGKRQHLTGIREHMDVVGNDGEPLGKVDKVRGDRIILTKSDATDHRHHSIDCSMIDTIDGDQIKLDRSAEDVKSRWNKGDDRGFFGRDDDRHEDHEFNLNRSFSGTYES